MQLQDLPNTLSYIHSELNRIETMAGTLATIEREHFNKLSNYDHRELMDIATAEQSASRQLGAIKQMCNSLAQKIEEIKNTLDRGETGGNSDRAEVH